MKSTFLAAAVVALLSCGAGAANTPKTHHAEMDLTCRDCHVAKGKFQRPETETCIDCHGGMSEIPTEPNRWDKNPHNSHHYEDLLECTACHSEHKASEAICVECHVVEFPNLK